MNFEKIDICDIKDSFTRLIRDDWALLTAGKAGGYNTMTVSWGGVGVLWGKNVVYIFIRDSRYTKEFIDNGEFFSMSFLYTYIGAGSASPNPLR